MQFLGVFHHLLLNILLLPWKKPFYLA